MTTKKKSVRKPFFERLADRVYILLGAIFISMGFMIGTAWWASDFRDYLLGSMAVYLLGSGLALTRLQDFYDQQASLMTRKSGLLELEGLPAQLWTSFWVFSFLVITAMGTYLVFRLATTGELDILVAIYTLLGLAVVRLGVYLSINSGKLPLEGLRVTGWLQAVATFGMLVVFWLVVIGMARIHGLPY